MKQAKLKGTSIKTCVNSLYVSHISQAQVHESHTKMYIILYITLSSFNKDLFFNLGCFVSQHQRCCNIRTATKCNIPIPPPAAPALDPGRAVPGAYNTTHTPRACIRHTPTPIVTCTDLLCLLVITANIYR